MSPPRASPALGLALLLAVPLAGCLAPVPGGSPFLGGQGPPVIAGGWYRDCAIATAGNWSDPCTARATVTHGPANELMLAVNPLDPDHVVIGAKDYTPEGSDCVWAGTSVTRDGGLTWENGWVGGSRSDRDPRLRAYDCVTDPVLEFGADGVLYYLVEAYGIGEEQASVLPGPLNQTPVSQAFGLGSNMWLAASTDGGSSWELRGVISLAPGNFLLLHDKSDLAVSPVTGTLVASWTAFNAAASQLLYARSTDGGRVWSPHRPLMTFSSPEQPGQTTAMVDLDFDAGGRLHAVWFNWDTGDVLYASSEDDGATFTEPRVLSPGAPWTGANAPNSQFRIFDSTMVAVDLTDGPRGGWLYVTWADDQLFEGDHDVWFMRSEDGGMTWNPPLQVNSFTGTDQFHPNLVVGPDGSVHLFMYDRQYDPGNRLLDVTHGISLDGGERWNWTRVTASSFDGDLGIHQTGVPFMGDYNGIGAGTGVVYTTWADTREGRSDVAVAKFRLRAG